MSVAWFGPGSPSDWGDEDPGFAVVSGVMRADLLPSVANDCTDRDRGVGDTCNSSFLHVDTNKSMNINYSQNTELRKSAYTTQHNH